VPGLGDQDAALRVGTSQAASRPVENQSISAAPGFGSGDALERDELSRAPAEQGKWVEVAPGKDLFSRW
jgi:hypothetical protein